MPKIRKRFFGRNKLLKKITGISRLHQVRNDDIRQSLYIQTTLLDKIIQRRLQWFGHVIENASLYQNHHNAKYGRFDGKRNRQTKTMLDRQNKEGCSPKKRSGGLEGGRQTLDYVKCQ